MMCDANVIGMMDSLKLARAFPNEVMKELPKTVKTGQPSLANRSLFETLASNGKTRAKSMGWHRAGVDTTATAEWLSSAAGAALLKDSVALASTRALVSMAQLTLSSHAENNIGC